jgi:CheY-like chemotaxis protein
MAVILVVDDEGPIQQLISRILERQGHRVITCGDASVALAVTEEFDLLIVDFVLPNMNGRDLTAELRKRRPGLPVILMSGYLPSPDLAPPPPSAFMQKPMRSGVIVDTVQKMLSS